MLWRTGIEIFMKMIKYIKDYLKTRPRLYDLAVRLMPNKNLDQGEIFFDQFSRRHGKGINFIQIGANDGLRWDPIRRFVVRDKWKGVFVEPIPDSFKLLRHNYSYIKNSDFVFVNAAVGASKSDDLKFWTCSKSFLDSLPLEDKMYYLRLASFDKEHLKKQLKQYENRDKILDSVDIPCLSVNDIIEEYWPDRKLDLLIIDAEGHEASIIPAIDFEKIKPEAIFYESHNLGDNKAKVEKHLKGNGYVLSDLGGDTLAELETV
jgi:FkbM family methyltransferase